MKSFGIHSASFSSFKLSSLCIRLTQGRLRPLRGLHPLNEILKACLVAQAIEPRIRHHTTQQPRTPLIESNVQARESPVFFSQTRINHGDKNLRDVLSAGQLCQFAENTSCFLFFAPHSKDST